MRMVSLVVTKDKVIEVELVTILWLDSPVEEGSKRIALHKAIEQPVDLLRSPHKLALDGGQHEVMTKYFV